MAVLPPGKRRFDWVDVQPLGVKKRLANYNRSRLDAGFECLAKASLADASLFTDDAIADDDILEAFEITCFICVYNCCCAVWYCVRTPEYSHVHRLLFVLCVCVCVRVCVLHFKGCGQHDAEDHHQPQSKR